MNFLEQIFYSPFHNQNTEHIVGAQRILAREMNEQPWYHEQ